MTDRKCNHAKGNSNDNKGVGMSNQELRREKRRQHALERLGTNTPRCAVRGETDWRCLKVHHIAGRDFDDATVILCCNDHRILSDDQKDHPPPASSPPSQLDRIGHFLLGLADLLIRLAEKCREYGLALIEYAEAFAEQQSEARS